MKTIHIRLEFLEPYRLIEWYDPRDRESSPRYLRGQTFGRWHKNGDGSGGRPYVTGTLLRSAVIRAAEELISLNDGKWDGKYCCNGKFETDGEKPSFLRKRPTLKWSPSKSVCNSAESACPFCLLLGRFDKAGGFDKARKSHPPINEYDIHFSNLDLAGKPTFNDIENIASRRVLNRVDSATGKAHDYFKIYEVDNEDWGKYTGKITLQDLRAQSLLLASLGFVDRLCGALCRIEISKSANNSCNTQVVVRDNEIMGNLKKQAKEIVDAFEKMGKIEKARILADAVRAMRLEKPGIIENLPPGMENKGHHLWDIKINNKPLREVLKELRPTNDNDWRGFCEHLGNDLYEQYKEKTGGLTNRSRILGETEYYSKPRKPSDPDHFIPFTPRWDVNKSKEWIIVGNLKAETPFFFGTEAEETEQTSLRILLDKKGRYRIPRSVMRGALRRDLRVDFGTGCDVELGRNTPCDCPVCIVMRKITIMDSRSRSDYVEPPEIRQRIRINPYTSTVDEEALFDIELGPEGISFPFILRYRGEELPYYRKKLPYELTSVIHFWKDGMAFLGGSGSTGKGRFSLVDLKVFEWVLDSEGLKSYIASQGLRGKESEMSDNKHPGLIECGLPDDEKALEPYNKYLKPQWKEVEYKIEIASPMLSADPISALLDQNNRDSIVYEKRVWDGNEIKTVPTIKGETIRGIMRTTLGKRSKDLEKEHEDCSCDLCSIFGNEHEVGKIRFEDLVPEQTFDNKHIDHVAIDRFHGGAEDMMKFDTYPLAGSPKKPLILKGRFWMRADLSKNHREKIAAGLSDIENGLYPIGGKTGTGYGWVSNLEILKAPEDLNLPERNEIVSTKRTYYTYPSLPHPAMDAKHIYYPHYFLKPADKVQREHKMIGHERFHTDFLSGKITCKLKTLTPLIIPDTEDEDAFGLIKTSQEHKSYKFFRINNEVMIPGSELRGIISSVYEALTNSCFRILDETRYISWRMDPADEESKKFYPGLVQEKDGQLKIVQVDACRLPLYDDLEVTNKIKLKDYKEGESVRDQKIKKAIKSNLNIANAAKRNREYLLALDEESRKQVLLGEKEVSFREEQVNPVVDQIAILVDKNGSQKGFIKFTGPNNANISNTDKPEEGFKSEWDIWKLNILLDTGSKKRVSNKHEYPRPFLSFIKNGAEYTISKRCERIFYKSSNRATDYPIPQKIRDQYNSILRDYRQNRKNIEENFHTNILNNELTNGDLVYFHLDKDTNKVDAIIPVRISRWSASMPLGKKLPDNLRPCERECLEDFDTYLLDTCSEKRLFSIHPDGLCPACQLFGTTSYRGRVRFGFAKLVNKPCWLKEGKDEDRGGPLTLPLLERPRPTWSMPTDNFNVPGRKFYVHHNGWADIKEDEQRTKNNRTVEPLGQNNEFRFEVFFENLEKWELGLLLYCLELEPGMGHKLGMGKSLGFGNVKIEIESLHTFTVTDSGIDWRSSENQIKDYIRQGMEKLKEWFGKEWYEIEHINRLRSLLWVSTSGPTVKYPVLNEKSEGCISGYTYEKLGDKKILSLDGRIKYLKEPWSPWYTHKAEGNVNWFNENRGFGFITQDSSEEIFVHINSVKDRSPLKVGQRVRFSIGQGKKGPAACDVEIVE